ncbi:hypothetical protein QWI17_20195 [Gilvimarinus sp. SDUM040013]|uniref:MSHA biogenesis protein MshN n=1 Tax=Gilvimarinus gilvus TaxID=3058038 RepID=A0ABU4RVJ6_9GAMM|nr:hypothetical protein [Gilvimarinus sp. SDUM040013]MDO3388178.1 hypothetical protein [Gilvimarinus sp. SDUM040013]MDX6847728.1 hypothetical protein [Gilvimarinus sp. SDUM040013]
MSLVNDMLRDLDGRNAVTEHQTTPLPSGLRTRPTPPWRVPMIGFMAVLPLGLLALFVYKNMLSAEQPEQDANAIQASVHESAVVQAAVQQEPTNSHGSEHSALQETTPAVAAPKAATPEVVTEDTRQVAIAAAGAAAEGGTSADTASRPELSVVGDSAVIDQPASVEASVTAQPPELANTKNSPEASTLALQSERGEPTSTAAELNNDVPLSESQLAVTPTLESLDQRAAQSARAALQDGDRSLARRLLLEFLTEQAARDQWPPQSRRLLAQIYIEADELARVESLMPAALPAQQAAYLGAQLAQERGEYDTALQILEVNYSSALEQDETYRALMAGLYQRLSRSAEAEAHYRRLLEAFGSRTRYWLGLAVALDRQGEFGSAATAYRQALQSRDITAALQQFIETRLQQLNGMY